MQIANHGSSKFPRQGQDYPLPVIKYSLFGVKVFFYQVYSLLFWKDVLNNITHISDTGD
jgi:hypothetical protein